MAQLLPLTDLELASGRLLGGEVCQPHDGEPAAPLEALSASLLPALERFPCVVAFSGGRDSSAVLAVATVTARRHGLPDPVPITIHYEGDPASQEPEWQELVVRHLALRDWHVLRLRADDHQLLGGQARDVLAALGVRVPVNAHMQAPIYAAARGGAALTGIDGDGVFGAFSRRRRPTLAGLRRRLRTVGHSSVPEQSWLTSRALAELSAQHADEPPPPRDWPTWLRWYRGRRIVALSLQTYDELGRLHDVEVAHPIMDPAFLAALGADGGVNAYGSRTALMRRVFGGLLPRELIDRPDKALLDTVLFGREVRRFAGAWDGSGLSADLVHPDRLRAEWERPRPVSASLLPLHAAYAASVT